MVHSSTASHPPVALRSTEGTAKCDRHCHRLTPSNKNRRSKLTEKHQIKSPCRINFPRSPVQPSGIDATGIFRSSWWYPRISLVVVLAAKIVHCQSEAKKRLVLILWQNTEWNYTVFSVDPEGSKCVCAQARFFPAKSRFVYLVIIFYLDPNFSRFSVSTKAFVSQP